jgi:hypothetical protein
VDILIALNIKLYEDRPQQLGSNAKGGREKTPKINH